MISGPWSHIKDFASFPFISFHTQIAISEAHIDCKILNFNLKNAWKKCMLFHIIHVIVNIFS